MPPQWAVYPQTQVQLCIVHLVRSSLAFVSHKDRKAVAEDLKSVYQVATVEEAERQLTQSEETWAAGYPVIARSWRQHWSRVVPMSGYPSEIRRAVYTTNTIESNGMKRLAATSRGGILLPEHSEISSGRGEQPWTISASTWVRPPVNSASSPPTAS